MLSAAQTQNSLAQPQLKAAYSSLRLQSRVLRSRSENGIWRGQDWCASISALRDVFEECYRLTRYPDPGLLIAAFGLADLLRLSPVAETFLLRPSTAIWEHHYIELVSWVRVTLLRNA
jgi:hypothetical protein